VSADGAEWLLINASPDIRQQLFDNPVMHPQEGLRHSPIRAVLLTNGDVDHVAGLLTLREGQPYTLYATPGILDSVNANRVFDVMAEGVVARQNVALETPFEPLPGLRVTLFAVPGKVPLWLEGAEVEIGAATETTVGAMIEAGGKRLAYVPGCALVNDEVRRRLDGADAHARRERLDRGPVGDRHRPPGLRPHQQHQPGPRGGFGGAGRRGGRGLDSRP